MSKIICDVCGTMYPETAAQCPICGCTTQASVETDVYEALPEEGAAGSYTYVKGGRFSKKNVRKRNKTMAKEAIGSQESVDEMESESADELPAKKKGDKTLRGLTITAVILALAIVAMVIYIALRFFIPVDFGGNKSEAASTPSATNSATVAVPATEIAVEEVPCTQIQMSDVSVELNEVGQLWMLHVVALPEDTTDEISFSSSDESIVTVSPEGTLTAVASGKAVITVTCGTVSTQCEVVCDFTAGETTEATTPETTEANKTTEATEESADPNANYTVLFYGEWREDNDVSMTIGESVEVTLEDDEGNVAEVTWKTEQSDIVSIDGSVFTVTGTGIAYVTTTYGSTEYTVIIRGY